MTTGALLRFTWASFLLLFLAACKEVPHFVDHPHLTPNVRLVDSVFQSVALDRPLHLRLIMPRVPDPHTPLSVSYLLHGAGVNFRDWANNSQIATLAERNFVLVMPDGEGSYYIDEASPGRLQYESSFVHEIMPEVHRLAPDAAIDREHSAIAGISRGGFGAVVLGLHHPELFSFVGDISGALDLPERRFHYSAPLQWWGLRKAFGPNGSSTRRANDPFLLVHSIPAAQAPFVFITCGDKDSLLDVNQRFNSLLDTHSFPHEFHTVAGGHSWSTWNEQMPLFEAALIAHLNSTAK